MARCGPTTWRRYGWRVVAVSSSAHAVSVEIRSMTDALGLSSPTSPIDNIPEAMMCLIEYVYTCPIWRTHLWIVRVRRSVTSRSDPSSTHRERPHIQRKLRTLARQTQVSPVLNRKKKRESKQQLLAPDVALTTMHLHSQDREIWRKSKDELGGVSHIIMDFAHLDNISKNRQTLNTDLGDVSCRCSERHPDEIGNTRD